MNLITPGVSDNNLEHLVVVTCISNPVRFKSRYELYRKWKKAMDDAGAKVITVELAFGDRPFEITNEYEKYSICVQVRSLEEYWHKENLINLGFQRAVEMWPHCKYLAWVDADVLPATISVKEWLNETVQQLQRYQIVQMFESACDLSPTNTVMNYQIGFMKKYIDSGCVAPNKGGFWNDGYVNQHGHPGYAWAANREMLDKIGTLIDFAILGAGDRHMALGLVGCIDQSFEHLNPSYRTLLKLWQIRALRYAQKDVGFVPVTINHMWHGKKKDRKYADRWKILKAHDFNPLIDLKRDLQGLWQLETYSQRQISLRNDLRAYFSSRNEDSTDVF
jgi:hypothetical protein